METTLLLYTGSIGLYRDNGQDKGNHYFGFRV